MLPAAATAAVTTFAMRMQLSTASALTAYMKKGRKDERKRKKEIYQQMRPGPRTSGLAGLAYPTIQLNLSKFQMKSAQN